MDINRENIKLYAHDRFTDENDGGRRSTGSILIDGQLNNIFLDI